MNMSQLNIALWTLITKEVRRFMRIWPQTLLPPAITMSLYFVIFGNLVGSRIGDMGGFSYMQFIVPGLIMMSVITNSYSNVCSSFFSAKFQKSIEELITSPVPLSLVLWGYVIGGICRGVLVGFIVTLVSLFFTHLEIHNMFITIYTVIITSLLFSIAGFINAVYARSFDDISIVPTFVLTPLTYLGGVFYAISTLSPFWQKLSLINPIVYMVNAFRYGILGHSDVNVTTSLIVITLFCAVFYAFAYYLLSRGSGIRE
ncbi:ABC transporter permease [Acinetobacter pollinis]|jgi:ABC-2 type transport system permease protein|uniref:ABC transporter permease n=1 Tax=Acinetobacter pollinis TaxID=2605270 RepID=UPI0018A2AE01|nr:ABC transporter permease [Acinetobacter pollinis]MBF7691484.1 ABC transporter permease [Acinetobacter pollinis]MBF7693440.1 ABC transporter permease [Acinetobacter pollinis]MBF7699165.1 ABC transporter permease [Acinetobacter pollinis]MBF7700952.1 ABC transporter permease [Acinetobacter pollinis]